MSNITPTTATPTALTGTNVYINLILLIASLFGGMSQDLATLLAAALMGIVGAFFAFRNWLVTAKFKLDKNWLSDPNHWAYLSASVTGFFPALSLLMPSFKDLANAVVTKNWTLFLTTILTAASIFYYSFIKKKD